MPFSKVPTDWAILCPGPSLKAVKEIDYDQGGLIAVNGAVTGVPWVPDYWTFLDGEVFASVNRRFPLTIIAGRTTIWTFHNVHHFATLPSLHPNWSNWTMKEKEAYSKFNVVTFDDLQKQMPFGSQLPWRLCSMFAAIALAVIQGARRVRIYGADMAGAGYFKEGFENERTNHRDMRWEHERFWFEEIVFACRNQDIEVTREGVHV